MRVFLSSLPTYLPTTKPHIIKRQNKHMVTCTHKDTHTYTLHFRFDSIFTKRSHSPTHAYTHLRFTYFVDLLRSYQTIEILYSCACVSPPCIQCQNTQLYKNADVSRYRCLIRGRERSVTPEIGCLSHCLSLCLYSLNRTEIVFLCIHIRRRTPTVDR